MPHSPTDQPGDDRPIGPVFLDALARYIEDPATGTTRTVPAREIHLPVGHPRPADDLRASRPHFTPYRRIAERLSAPICVLERSDGTLWAYDDIHLVSLYQALVPDLVLLCVVIGSDPTPPDTEAR